MHVCVCIMQKYNNDSIVCNIVFSFLYKNSFLHIYHLIALFHLLLNTDGVGNGNQLQYSCLENSVDRGAWQATVHAVAENQTPLSLQRNRLYTGLLPT